MSNKKRKCQAVCTPEAITHRRKMRGSHYRDVGKNDSTANEQSTLPIALIPMIPYF